MQQMSTNQKGKSICFLTNVCIHVYDPDMWEA
jgi:hypothetical protein